MPLLLPLLLLTYGDDLSDAIRESKGSTLGTRLLCSCKHVVFA
jgi:hypothetical protein